MPSDAATSGEPIVPTGSGSEPSCPVPAVAARVEGEVKLGPKPLQPFNLRKPSLLTAGELRRLRFRHEEFVRSLAARLSIHLRLEIGVQVVELETSFYPQLIERLLNPTRLALFKVESLEGVGLLEIPPKLGMAFVDRLLGGSGKAVASTPRDLTEIETALLDQIIDVILKEWCGGVASLPQAKAVILDHETNPRFSQITPNDTSVLILALEFHFNDCTEKVHLGLPYPMLQPVIRLLNPPLEPKKESTPSLPTTLKWNPELNSVNVALSVEWDGLAIDARKLVHLKVGDILPVDPGQINNTSVNLANVPKFTGRLGKCGSAWAIELMRTI